MSQKNPDFLSVEKIQNKKKVIMRMETNFDVQVGKVFIGRVVKLGVKGDGITFLGKMVVFLPNTSVGKKYKFEILRVSDKFANGNVIETYGGAE